MSGYTFVAFALFFLLECSTANPWLDNYLYVEEVYGKTYVKLPLTTNSSEAKTWTIAANCTRSKGRLAESSRWGNSLKLWFDKGGYVIGLRASVASYNKTLSSLWTRVGNTSTYTTDIFFRDSTSACVNDIEGDSYTKEFFGNNSIGDRLYVPSIDTNLPLTWPAADKRNWTEVKGCVKDMGVHYYEPRLNTTDATLGTMYNHDGDLTGFLLSVFTPQAAPYELWTNVNPNPYSLRVYIRNWRGSCTNPPLWWASTKDFTTFSVTGYNRFGKIFRGQVGNTTSYFLGAPSGLKQFYESTSIRRRGCNADPFLLSTIWGSPVQTGQNCPYTVGLPQMNVSQPNFATRKGAVTTAFRESLGDDQIFTRLRSESYAKVRALKKKSFPWIFEENSASVVIPAFLSAFFSVSEEETYEGFAEDLSYHFEAFNLPYFEVRNYTATRQAMKDAHKRIYDFLKLVLDNHVTQKYNDFVSRYLDQPGVASLAEQQKLVDLYTIVHGAEKLRRSLAHVFVGISRSKGAREELLDEVKENRKKDTESSAEKNLPKSVDDMVKRYPVARAIVNEALRLWNQYQVIEAVTAGRVNVTDGNTTYAIPSNSTVYGCLHATNHDLNEWRYPVDDFDYSRWEDRNDTHWAFGYGNVTTTHTCAAESASRSILQLLTIEFANVWEWSVEEKYENPLTQFFPSKFLSGVEVISNEVGLSSGAIAGIALGIFIFFAILISGFGCMNHSESSTVDTAYL